MKTKSFSRICFVLCLILLFALSVPSPAFAGVKGQQLRINNVCFADSVRIIGSNQDYKRTDVSFRADPNKCVNIETNGWWWLNTVLINVYYPDTTYGRVLTNVPIKQDNSDWWTVSVPALSEYVVRGYQWVKKPVVYGIVFNNGQDPNPDDNHYSVTKGRYSRSVEDNSYYRTDCSGFVSYAWNLRTSKNTVELGTYAKDIAYSDLQPGDIVNNKQWGEYGHVILFVRWIDKNNNEFWAYEESGGQGKTVLSTMRLAVDNKGKIIELKKLNSKGDFFYSYGNGPWFAQRKP